MVNRDLLKEAIADAKAVKETAIANAKAALEEAFAPRMKEMLAAKISEMDEMEEEELKEAEMEEEGLEETYDTTEEAMDTEKMEEAENVDEVDLEELLRELDEIEEGEKEEMTEGEDLLNDPKDSTSHGNVAEEEGEGEEEEIDIENMDEDDLKKFIESVIADMVAAGELEGNIESEEGEEESEEEVEIDEVKKEMKKTEKVEEIVGSGTDFAQLADTLGVSIDAAKYLVVAGGLAVPAILAAVKVGGEKAIEFFKKMAMKKSMAEAEEMEEMKSELEEAYNTIKTIKEELAEINLFNAKLLYTNKIFKAKNLTESQKVKVLAAFDKAASVNEAKLVFETLTEGFKEKKAPVNESLLRGSASKVAGVAEKKPIMEVNDQFARWQTLAGIKK